MDNKALVGLKNGTIFRLDLEQGSKKKIMESHCKGEVWGLDLIEDYEEVFVLTSGDDNQAKVWNVDKRKCENTAIISKKKREAPKGGASTLSKLPAS